MKPPEILAMLEEATGTRMYEDKKRETQRTIEKKDAKLEQIDNVLREDLEPQMQKLAQDRQAYDEYKTVSCVYLWTLLFLWYLRYLWMSPG